MKHLRKHKQAAMQQVQQGFNQLTLKERALTSLLGVGVLLGSIACFILLLYLITIAIRLFFAW